MSELDFKTRYDLESPIGQGGMGRVFKAWDNVLHCQAAVKILHSETCANPRLRASFNREARAYALLNHPHIVSLLDFGQTDTDRLYLSTELIRGVSLNAVNQSDFPLCTVIDILTQILDALEHAHRRVLIHCDIKAENVLMTVENHQICAKIADFGLAALPSDSRIDISHIGTPAYMAPEQILSQTDLIGPCTDIYAVGILLYEALTGRLPYSGDDSLKMLKAHLESPIPNIDWKPHFEGLSSRIKSQLQAILQRALAKKPWQRFISVGAFRDALKEISVVPVPIDPENPVWVELLNKTRESTVKATEVPVEELREKIRAFEAAEDSGLRRSHAADLQMESGSWEPVPKPGLPQEGQASNRPVSDSYRYITEIARTHEFSIVKRDAERALHGRGMQRLVIGGFGSGKTRFLKYVSEKLIRGRFRLITCTPQIQQDLSNFHISDEDYSAAVFSKFMSQLLGDLGSEQYRLLSARYLNGRTLSEVTAEIEQMPSKNDPILWDGLIDTTLQVLQEVAQSGPVAILIDDLQRCGTAVFRFLNQLRMIVTSCAILSLVNYDSGTMNASREILHSDLRSEFRLLFDKAIVFGPISPKNMKQILKSCWRIEERLSMRIANESFGNPYYAMSLVKHLQQTSRLFKTPLELYALAPDDIKPLGVPETVLSYLEHKIDSLAPVFGTNMEIYREILARTAIFGAEMYMHEAEQFWSMDNDMALSRCWRDAVQAWCDVGMLIMPTSISLSKNSDQKLQFAEPWFAEAIQAGIPERKKKALKSQAAIALIECYESPSYEELWRIAKLWRDASDTVAYIQFCYQSAGTACEMLEYQFALDRWENLAVALDVILTRDISQNELIHAIYWPEALIQAAETALILDKSSAFEQFCTRLKTFADRTKQPVYLGNVHLLMAKQNLRRGNVQRAEEMALQAKSQFDTCGSLNDARRACLTLADAMIQMGKIPNAKVVLEDILRGREDGSLVVMDEAEAGKRLAKIEWFAGNTRGSKELIERSIQIYQDHGDTAAYYTAQLSANLDAFLEMPSEQTLYPLLNASETVADFQDVALAIVGKTCRLLAWILTANWDSIHHNQQTENAKIPAASLITGMTVCARAVEGIFNRQNFEAANDIATALACFGPNYRRARAWCHGLMGLHAVLTCSHKQSAQAFERAVNDFEALGDQYGILAVELGLALQALMDRQYETAFSSAKAILISAILYQYSIHSTIAHAIALKAAVDSGNYQWYSQCPSHFRCALPDIFKPAWKAVMVDAAESMEKYDPRVAEHIRGMMEEIADMPVDVGYPSIDIRI